SMVVNVTLSLLLFPVLQHVGIALATTAAAWGNALMLAGWLARRGHFRPERAELGRLALIVVISFAMALLLLGLYWPIAWLFVPEGPILLQAVALAALCAAGLAAYFAAIHFSGVQPLGLLFRRLRRSR